MAHNWLKPEKIAATALGLLERELVLANTIFTDGGAQFTGAKNDTVTIRIPARLDAREYEWRNDRASEIVMDDLVEDSIDVKLNKDIYSAVQCTDEQMTLDIADFGDRVLSPQVEAVAYAIDNGVASLISNATYATTLTLDDADPYKTAVAARKQLNKNLVSKSGRILLVGSDVEEKMLLSDRFTRADSIGDSDASSAIHEATVGRIAGFTVVSSEAIDPGDAFAYVPSAFAASFRAPVIPGGASFGKSLAYNGLAMRWVRDYDATRMRDRSVVNIYAGFNTMTDKNRGQTTKKLIRAIKIETGTGG
ncbi:P22 phage major capsid protein family protein [Streptomyces sp. NPDC056230]|uniref:P22 phage major capsid protein family protein n=1 Tax=Streptomyces sp. NPDC056230 TaxID=3345754 RepID=UPI0035D7FFCD